MTRLVDIKTGQVCSSSIRSARVLPTATAWNPSEVMVNTDQRCPCGGVTFVPLSKALALPGDTVLTPARLFGTEFAIPLVMAQGNLQR